MRFGEVYSGVGTTCDSIKMQILLLAAPCCMWELVPWPWIEPVSPALGARSLNHWTSREVPWTLFGEILFLFKTNMSHGYMKYLFILPLAQLLLTSLSGISFEESSSGRLSFLMHALPKHSVSFPHLLFETLRRLGDYFYIEFS